MDIWETLGLRPTTDIVAIKKAYAARAKECHPEEHPEEFKKLRTAYRTAVTWAKNGVVENAGADGEPEPAVQKGEPTAAKEREEAKEGEEAKSAEPEPGKREADSEPQFSYEDVSSFCQKGLAEQFFKEFHWIAWNPYLQNRKAVWSYFLFRRDYNGLYYHESFRQKLLMEICAVPGWHSDTLDYFEWWFKLYWEANGSMETDGWLWRRKKLRNRFSGLLEHAVFPELRQKHYEILKTMRDRGYDDSFLNEASASAYLKYYGAFIKDNEDLLENQRKFRRRKRVEYGLIFGALCFYLTITLIIVLVVRPALDAAEEEKTRQQIYEEVTVEQEEQEEWRRELDERFENMSEQYNDWMEQDLRGR